MRGLLIIPALLVAALVYVAADDATGIQTWLRQRDSLESSDVRIGQLEAEIEALEREVGLLRGDAFAIERAIREDLEYAKRGETIVRLSKRRARSARNPRFP